MQIDDHDVGRAGQCEGRVAISVRSPCPLVGEGLEVRKTDRMTFMIRGRHHVRWVGVAGGQGVVSRSSSVSQRSAWLRCSPHISAEGCRPLQQAGRLAVPKMAQR